MLGTIRRIAVCVLAVLIVGTTPYVFSQSNNASIDGEITDPNGAVVQGAQVILESKDTKQTSTFVSDPNGLYSFQNVLPGIYQLTVKAQGFGGAGIAYSGSARPTLSATQTGLSPPSASTVNLVTTWTQPPPTSSTLMTSAEVRSRESTGTGAGKRTRFQP